MFTVIPISFRSICLVAVAAWLLAFTGSSQAQVLVYDVNFSHATGVNYEPFTAGYFVVPILGGTGSFVLTSADDRTYTTSASSGTLFTAVTVEGQKNFVINAATGSGTAQGSMMAFGKLSHSIHILSQTTDVSVQVAAALHGVAVSADSEVTTGGSSSTTSTTGTTGTTTTGTTGTTTTTGTTGTTTTGTTGTTTGTTTTPTVPLAPTSIGSAGFSQLTFTLDESETKRANANTLSLTDAVTLVESDLTSAGYTASTTTTGSTGTTGTTTGTTTTGTTTTGTTTTGN